MNPLNDQLIQQFRFSLPVSHNLEMWVNETIVEYERASLLWSKGVKAMPIDGTLLAILIKLAGNDIDAPYGNDLDKYETHFGTPPDYCWTTSVDKIFGQSAAAATQPATAWVSYSKLM
ncbi:hypothetical protein [Roseovarius sp. D22-M7]|uniref:hypothetical protein n=1 Tax=Roseovarius sp. D22-M7 TaxID=3127116 RepID=UPI00300FB869